MTNFPKCPTCGGVVEPDAYDMIYEDNKYIILKKEGYCDGCHKFSTWKAKYQIIDITDFKENEDEDDEEEEW
jgi:hypothetical protein